MSVPRALIPALICASAVVACSGPPSVDQADAALKQVPQVNWLMALMGPKARSPDFHLIADLSCKKSGDRQYDCEVLMTKNSATGEQPTVPVRFVKLSGQWHAVLGSN